ncbi:hypothetical protein ACR9GO_18825 [Kosakonia cowanii]
MEIHLPMDVVITDGAEEFTELDFYYGAKALEGTSEIVAILTNTILNREVVTKVPSIEGINSSFRNNYEGSFGQKFILKIVGEELQRAFREIGERTFFDLVCYYLSRPTMSPYEFNTARARRIINEMRDLYIPLMKRLHNPLLKLHKPIEQQSYKVLLKHKRKKLIEYNRNTLANLEIETPDRERIIINASVTRFNRLTGTGRIILDEDAESVSFEPAILWRDFPRREKKKLSRNLDANNQVDDFTTLTLEVTPVRDYIGAIKKYSLHKVIIEV